MIKNPLPKNDWFNLACKGFARARILKMKPGMHCNCLPAFLQVQAMQMSLRHQIGKASVERKAFTHGRQTLCLWGISSHRLRRKAGLMDLRWETGCWRGSRVVIKSDSHMSGVGTSKASWRLDVAFNRLEFKRSLYTRGYEKQGLIPSPSNFWYLVQSRRVFNIFKIMSLEYFYWWRLADGDICHARCKQWYRYLGWQKEWETG